MTSSFALANTSDVTVPGPAKLGAFLEKHDISKRQAARDLRVSAPTVLDWLNEVKRPEKPNRKAIEVYTGGEVVESDWENDKEREEAERVAGVKPFEPTPDADPAPSSTPAPSDSGEHPAVSATGTEGDR